MKKFKLFFNESIDDYRMTHKAPDRSDTPMHKSHEMWGNDVHDKMKFKKFHGQGSSLSNDQSIHHIHTAVKNGSEHKVTAYRAVPKHVTSINKGDWVSPSLKYATDHGHANLKGKHGTDWHVVKKEVPAKHLHTDGNSVHEWGYNPH